MVGGEKHPSPDAIYYILSNGYDFQGQFGSAPPQEAITHSFLPLTSQGTALDIRGVRIHNCASPIPPEGGRGTGKSRLCRNPLMGDESTLDFGVDVQQAPWVTGSPKQLPSLLRRERVFPLWPMGEAKLQFDAGCPRPSDFAVLSEMRQIH